MKFFKDKLLLSLLGVFAVLVVCVAYLFASVLDTPLTHRPPTLIVDLKETGGLYKGSSVTYRGVKVGKVTDIALADGGAEATVKLSTNLDIPTDTLVKVRSLSPIGEQYLDFQPNTDQGPFLANGAHIPATATEVPRTLSSTVVNINKVLNQIDPDHLHRVLVALATGLNGTGDDLGRMVDQGDAILTDLQTFWPQTQSLLRNGSVALDIGSDNAGNIQSMATSAKQFGEFLKSYDPELRKQLDAAPGQISTLSDLVTEVDQIAPGFLQTAGALTQIFAVRDGQFRALLQRYSSGLGTISDAIHDGQLNIKAYLQRDSRCSYGTPRKDPTSTHRTPMPLDKQCGLNLPRGARAAR